MRTLKELMENSQVQITNNVITPSEDIMGIQGFLNLRESKKTMSFMATVDDNSGMKWEHVSISYYGENKKTPSWAEMCAVKNIFWGPDEEVHQIHPKECEYVHSYAQKENILHLWRPVDGWEEG